MSTPKPGNDSGRADGATAAESPVLPDVTRDERDEGWGDDPRESRRDDEWYRRERPPHHE